MQQVKIVKNGNLKLSNAVATNYINNLISANNGKTMTIRELESALNTALNKKLINTNDYKKIANYFGFQAE